MYNSKINWRLKTQLITCLGLKSSQTPNTWTLYKALKNELPYLSIKYILNFIYLPFIKLFIKNIIHTTCCEEYGIWTCSAKSHEIWNLISSEFASLMGFISWVKFLNASFEFFIQSLKIKK